MRLPLSPIWSLIWPCVLTLLAWPAHAQDEPPVPEPAAPAPLTVDHFLATFGARDAELQAAAWGSERANHARRAAEAPEQLDLYAAPRLGGVAWYPGLSTVAGELGSGVAGAAWSGPTGSTAGIEAYGSLYAPASSNILATEAGIDGWWSLPLARNSGGRLYALATEAAAEDEAAAQQLQQAVQAERCWAATGAYLRAWNLEQQVLVFDEFLARKESARKATARDVARGMLHRLELYTAESELAATRSRRLALRVQADSARAVLATWQEPQDQGRPLGDPAETVSGARSALDSELARPLGEHPAALAVLRQASARRLDADWVAEDWRTSVDLVPYAGASNLTGLHAGVALSVSHNLIAPRADPQVAQLRAAASQLDARHGAVLLELAERDARASRARDGAAEQLALNEERLVLIDKQVKAAWRQYQDGRIELQDYLQHYALYEQARLESVQLALTRDLAVLEQAALHLDAPEVCR